jgi:uncharacterized membrane protein
MKINTEKENKKEEATKDKCYNKTKKGEDNYTKQKKMKTNKMIKKH